MNQFDKNQIITLDILDPQQIKAALIQYQALLSNGLAFNGHQFDVEFKKVTSGGVARLQPSDAGTNYSLLTSALDKGQEGGDHYYKHEITDDREIYISEVILFAAALQYPEIRSTVVDSVKAIVAYARKVNDTDDLWLDDMRVFGIEAVYMLAKTELQYAYLIGQFFIPYWDDEHATHYESYLASLLVEHGWHPEVIKAFIWCDNPDFRLGMFMNDRYEDRASYQPLGEYLKQNPDRYPSFKEMVLERFIAEPVLLASNPIDDDDEDENSYLTGYHPVVWLYKTLFAHTSFYDDQEALDAFMQQPFMDSTLENEAYDLEQYVQSQVNGALVKISESALIGQAIYKASRERDDRRFDLNYGSSVLKPLILAMPDGEQLWRYIESGTDLTALNALEELELLPLAQAHAPEMAAHMEYSLSCWEYNNQGVLEELHTILELVRGDLLTDHFSEESTIEQTNGLIVEICVTRDVDVAQFAQRRQQYLRVLDVFYRALGKRELGNDILQALTEDESPLLSRQEYYQRYSQCSEPETETENDSESALERAVQAIFHTFTDEDELLYKKHFEHVDQVLRKSRELCHPTHWSKSHMGYVALASYQLYRDFHESIGDNVTEALFNYLNEQNIWNMAASHILSKAHIKGSYHCPENKGLSEEDIARINEYFTADQPKDDQATLLALLEPQLLRDDCCRGELYINKVSEYQPGYYLFSDHDEDFQRFTLIAFWLRQLPLPLRMKANRLWQFVIALAPVRVARNILRAYSEQSREVEFSNVLEEIELHERLQDAGINRGILKAYEMSRQFYDIKRYQAKLDAFSEITSTDTSMFGSFGRKKALEMQEGLKFISENHKVEFLHHASLKYPEITLDIQHDLKRALHIFVQLNIKSWEYALASELGNSCLYVGASDKIPEKLRKPIIADAHTVHDKPCHIDGYSWLHNTIVQQRGEKNVLLMADQHVLLDTYENDLPRGHLVILAPDADCQSVLMRIQALQNRSMRIDYLVEQTLAYLEGDLDHTVIASLYSGQIYTDHLRPNADEYRLYSLGQFIWMLDKPQRDRLAKLLFNHDYRGFKIVEQNFKRGWLLEQLVQGDIDFDTYLELEREHYTDEDMAEQIMHFFINWLIELEIRPAHITLLCIKRAQYGACREFIHNHARGHYGDFNKTLDYLHAGRRAQLPEILSQATDAAQLLELLSKDRSRVVKEAIAKHVAG